MVDFDYYANGVQQHLGRFDLNDEAISSLTTGVTGQQVGATDYGIDLANGRVARIGHSGPNGAAIATYQYMFDELGLVNQLFYDNRDDQYDFDVDYSYDALGQLEDAIYGVDGNGVYQDEFYRYDHNGNRTSSYLHGDGYVTGTGNRLLSDGTYDYQYDADGNLIRKELKSNPAAEFTIYTWDHRGRLTNVEIHKDGATTTVEYTYDLENRRTGIVTQEPGAAEPTVTRMVYDGDHVWADFDAVGEVAARYLFGDKVDQILARKVVSTAEAAENGWYLTDNQGTVRSIVTSTGSPTLHASYTSYGIVSTTASAGTFDRYLFMAREANRVGLGYHFRARTMDAGIGRFTSEDPSRFDAGDATVYRFVNNSPTNFTDPTGRISIASFASFLGRIVGTVASALTRFGFTVAARFVDITVRPALYTLNEIFVAQGAQAAARSAVYGYVRGVVQAIVRGPGAQNLRQTLLAELGEVAKTIGGRPFRSFVYRLLGP
jgi:RHS repeat-associated protein